MSEQLGNSSDINERFGKYMRDPFFRELADDCLSLSTEELVVGWEHRIQVEAEIDLKEKVDAGTIVLGEN